MTRCNSVSEAFREQVRNYPQRVAVTGAGRALTYSELDDRSNRLARLLKEAGVRHGNRVGVCVGRTPDLVVALLAVLKAGAAYVPLDPSYPPERLAFIVEDAEVSLVISDGSTNSGGLRESATVAVDAEPVNQETPLPPVSGDTVAYVIHTSGSTGRPKGVIVPHRNVTALVDATRSGFDLGPDDVWTLFHSFAFDFSVWEMWGCLLTGGRLVIVPHWTARSPQEFRALLATERVTVLNQTPSAFAPLDLVDASAADPLALRLLVFGGEPLDQHMLAGWFERHPTTRVENMYGITETTVHCTWQTVTPADAARGSRSVGRPLPGWQIFVVGPDGQPVAPGTSGEIVVGGAGVALGYLNRPELTEQRFVVDSLTPRPEARLYRSGDLGRCLPDGTLEHLGRIDDQVKIRGHRIEPGEIEVALRRHADVKLAVVIAHEGRLHAFVVPEDKPKTPDGRCTTDRTIAAEAVFTDSVRESLLSTLPAYMIPSSVTECDAIPLTPNGKTDREALIALITRQRARRSSGTPPRTPRERALATIWESVLGCGQVSVEDDFFALGGDSISAMRLIASIQEATGRRVSVLEVFESRVLADMAALIPSRPVRNLSEPVPEDGHPVYTDTHSTALSPAQHALWLTHRLHPGCVAYNVPVLLELRGDLDEAALVAAFDDVTARHASLRTSFPLNTEGRPVRSVEVGPRGSVTRLDAREKTAAEVCALVDNAAKEPFDLADGPLWRAVLVRTEAARHLLLIVVHHLVTDGWSMEVLKRDLGVAYAVRVRHGDAGTPGLTALPHSGVPASAAEPASDADLEFWRDRLTRLPSQRLPLARPRTAPRRFHAERTGATLQGPTVDALHALAHEEGTTLFTVLLTGYTMLLTRYHDDEEVIVGTPTAGRSQPGVADVVGYFNQTLPLRCRIPRDATVREAVRLVHLTVSRSLHHGNIPFEQLVARFAPARTEDDTPFFQSWFNFLSYPSPTAEFPGLDVSPQRPPLPGSLFDLGVYLSRRGDVLDIDVVFDPDVLEARRMAVFAEQLTETLRRLAERPDHRTGALLRGLPPVAERRAPLLATTEPDSANARLDAAARHAGVALAADGTEYGYSWLARAVADTADALRRAGVGPGDVVAVATGRTPALAVTVLAVRRVGAVFWIVDPEQPSARLARMAGTARPRLWIGTPPDGRAPEPVGDLATCLDPYGPRGEIRVTEQSAELVMTPDRPLSGTEAGALSSAGYIAFTSGTTGEPRGVLGTERAVDAFFDWYAGAYGCGPDDRFSVLAGLGHDPLLRELLLPLRVGGTVCLPPAAAKGDPVQLLDWLDAQRVSVLHLTPALLRLLAAAATRRTLASVRLVALGGAPVSSTDLRAARGLFPAARPIAFYGTTETPQGVSVVELDEQGETDSPWTSLGRGTPLSELLVVDSEGGLANTNEVGEVAVRSPFLALGYAGQTPDNRRFLADPEEEPGVRVYRTGDAGRLRPDGTVEFLGRRDRQLSVLGHRVEPAEIEQVAREHPDISDCRVFLSDGILSIAVASAEDSADDVRRHLEASLPAHMVPPTVVRLTRLPLTGNGKVDDDALRQSIRAGQQTREKAHDPMLRVIAHVWEEVLGVSGVDIDTNFFDAGGTSLKMFSVLDRLHARVKPDIELIDLFRHPTVASLARSLTGPDSATTDPVTTVPRQSLRSQRALRQAARVRAATPPVPPTAD